MRKEEVNRKTISTVLGVLFFLFLFTLVLFVIANFRPLYRYFFTTYGVYQNFSGYNVEFLDAKFFSVLDYLNYTGSEPDVQFFSSEDILHLQDVRNLFGVFYFAGTIAGTKAVFLVFYFKVRAKEFLNSVRIAAALQIAFAAILLLISFLNFHDLFIAFHKTVFNNEFWLLDPATSNLIKYLPEAIFRDIAVLLFTVPVAVALILYLFAVIWFRLMHTDAEQKR